MSTCFTTRSSASPRRSPAASPLLHISPRKGQDPCRCDGDGDLLPEPRRRIMSELRATTTQGTGISLEESVVETFKASLRGALLRPGEAGYDEARTIHNGMIGRRPALIA